MQCLNDGGTFIYYYLFIDHTPSSPISYERYKKQHRKASTESKQSTARPLRNKRDPPSSSPPSPSDKKFVIVFAAVPVFGLFVLVRLRRLALLAVPMRSAPVVRPFSASLTGYLLLPHPRFSFLPHKHMPAPWAHHSPPKQTHLHPFPSPVTEPKKSPVSYRRSYSSSSSSSSSSLSSSPSSSCPPCGPGDHPLPPRFVVSMNSATAGSRLGS